MSTFLAANNAGTTLSSTLNQTATTMAVAVGTGALFPQPNAALGQYFSMTLIPQTSTTGLPNEIVWVTQVTGDTMTILRGQEGTTPLTFAVGDYAQNLWTAGQAAGLVQAPQAQAQTWNYGTDTGTANAGVVSFTPALLSAALTGVPLRILKMGQPNTGAYTLTVNGIGPIPVRLPGSSGNLSAGALPAGGIFQVVYDGTVFELTSTPGIIGISGAAGGDLTGTYPNPVVAQNVVGNSKLAQMLADTMKMNNTGATANAQDVPISTFIADYVDPLIPNVSAFITAAYLTPTNLGFTTDLAGNGYIVLPGGLILQWGSYTGGITTPNSYAVSWPRSFTVSCFGAIAGIINTTSDTSTVTGIQNIAKSTSGGTFLACGYQSSGYNSVEGFFYIAIGY